MEGVTSQSTPVQSKKSDDSYEMFKMIQVMLEKHTININSRFDSNEEKFDNKFDKLSNDFDRKFDVQNNKFDELKNQINEINKHLEKNQ